jgi:hypothetical protein
VCREHVLPRRFETFSILQSVSMDKNNNLKPDNLTYLKGGAHETAGGSALDHRTGTPFGQGGWGGGTPNGGCWYGALLGMSGDIPSRDIPLFSQTDGGKLYFRFASFGTQFNGCTRACVHTLGRALVLNILLAVRCCLVSPCMIRLSWMSGILGRMWRREPNKTGDLGKTIVFWISEETIKVRL